MIQDKFSLKSFNTFGVNVMCSQYFSFIEIQELDDFIKCDTNSLGPFFILGGGSNVLFRSDFDGLVIHPKSKTVEVVKENNDEVIVRVAAGMNWDDFVNYSVNKSWQGLENLTLIPGNVGASPVQNIGAYGTEVSEVIHSVLCYDLKNRRQVVLSNQQCEFSYRDSVFKREKELLVYAVEFKLNKSSFGRLNRLSFFSFLKEAYTQTFKLIPLCFKMLRIGSSTNWKLKMNFNYMRDVLKLDIIPNSLKRSIVKYIRSRNMPDPKKIGNVGCFYKNPIVEVTEFERILKIDPKINSYPLYNNHLKISAGDLIRSCEWNGKRVGDVSVEVNRPLIILNHGRASGDEIWGVAKKIIDDVYKKFGVKIEPEVVVNG
ncbi:FAD-binding protein [Vibrio sp. 1CM23M]|uniref:FAD-binding protein n=1 Tax=Vibrio sp. 1CM23M TaxID=2929164 RepID=UPI0020BEC26B|nr:FAD-binding protein [Vibrio sp. 1CM23M]MCK8071268.1 FAD-binding protein [Vibrio sp. 1CM23M]